MIFYHELVALVSECEVMSSIPIEYVHKLPMSSIPIEYVHKLPKKIAALASKFFLK
jgi:hypothetical protein